MHFCIVLIAMVLSISNQRVPAQSAVTQNTQSALATDYGNLPARDVTPVVNDWEPKTGSINSVIELRGLRLELSNDKEETTRVLFIQNGIELPTRSTGSSGITNDEFGGAQTLDVVVPEEATMGVGQFVIDRNGRRSAPATVTITDWKLPVLKGLSPRAGPPGIIVGVECEGFHIDDEIEITNFAGKRLRIGGGGSSACTAFGVPNDAAEGVLSVRIVNKKQGKGQYTEPLSFTVTNEPLPLDLVTYWMRIVAPGQWLDLQASNIEVLKHSDRSEVAFKQAGRTIVVAFAKPFRPHVEVPHAFSPGEVQLQVRTWREDRPSEWSEPRVIVLPERPLPPAIGAIRLADGPWVHLWPGPDRPETFTVHAGDELVMNGLWPVEDASKLKFSLVRMGAMIELSAVELNENSNDVRVRLPDSLSPGDWRLMVSNVPDGSHDEMPLVIKVPGQ